MATVSSLGICPICSAVLETEDREKGACRSCGEKIPEPRKPLPQTRFQVFKTLKRQAREEFARINARSIPAEEKQKEIDLCKQEFIALTRSLPDEYFQEILEEAHYVMTMVLPRVKNKAVLAVIVAVAKRVGKIGEAIQTYQGLVDNQWEPTNEA